MSSDQLSVTLDQRRWFLHSGLSTKAESETEAKSRQTKAASARRKDLPDNQMTAFSLAKSSFLLLLITHQAFILHFAYTLHRRLTLSRPTCWCILETTQRKSQKMFPKVTLDQCKRFLYWFIVLFKHLTWLPEQSLKSGCLLIIRDSSRNIFNPT